MNPRTPASVAGVLKFLHRLLKLLSLIIIGFFFTPSLFLATKVTFHLFTTCQKLSNALKSLKTKKILQESTIRVSERASAILHIISITHSCACAQFTS